ncbi:hypothetical protein CVT26_004138 [Gymnopilus dilepis]|uniref:Uncharacterized protein n=1 Tax=Gymnopilus dilepis TaxID=231916 RepID=A0A409YVF1_9AGAR|nr:hypothetical protein CVT26_004138 [Gymnopilus dilepis]
MDIIEKPEDFPPHVSPPPSRLTTDIGSTRRQDVLRNDLSIEEYQNTIDYLTSRLRAILLDRLSGRRAYDSASKAAWNRCFEKELVAWDWLTHIFMQEITATILKRAIALDSSGRLRPSPLLRHILAQACSKAIFERTILTCSATEIRSFLIAPLESRANCGSMYLQHAEEYLYQWWTSAGGMICELDDGRLGAALAYHLGMVKQPRPRPYGGLKRRMHAGDDDNDPSWLIQVDPAPTAKRQKTTSFESSYRQDCTSSQESASSTPTCCKCVLTEEAYGEIREVLDKLLKAICKILEDTKNLQKRSLKGKTLKLGYKDTDIDGFAQALLNHLIQTSSEDVQ